MTLAAVIDTHGHADHVSCRETMLTEQLADQQSDALGWPENTPCVTIHGIVYHYITIGEKWLLKAPTPGHTEDSISLLLCEPVKDLTKPLSVHYAFCGDLILMGSLGRTNFSCSSAAAMYVSLQRLNSLIGSDTLLCPSHDYNNEFVTSIGAEMSVNSLLAQVINNDIYSDDFALQKALMDKNIVDKSDSEIICGAINGDCDIKSIYEYSSASLNKAIKQENNIKLIDIRESHEYALQHDEMIAENVPLTSLVHFIQKQLNNKKERFVLVCRSGSRSYFAAQALSRLGFNNVGHLKGGYALHQDL